MMDTMLYTVNAGLRETEKVPSWARAEQLERNLPLRELWRYRSSAAEKSGVFAKWFGRTK